jgi:hypothetical protein
MAAVVIMNSFDGPPTTNLYSREFTAIIKMGDTSSEPSAAAREARLPESTRLAHRAKLAGKIFLSEF